MKILERLKKTFSDLKSNLHDIIGKKNQSEEVYGSLTPKIITDCRMDEYFKALDFAFSKRDVKNIAITGPYGAGKSTVILSYLTAKLKKDYINVSLADFSISGKKDEKPPENAEIELSILQQILYKENKDNLPDSRVDRIQSRDLNHVISLFVTSASIAFPLFLFCLSVFPKKILSSFGASDSIIYLVNNAYPERLWCSIILAFITLFFIVRVASKAGIFDKKLKLSKLAFLQASAEVAQQESSSLLNNCLDEIVYFFSRSNNKIVVFEDLDRLGNTEVFVKLREINQIVNNNLKNNPVRFVYACRDDIFLGSDIRTKFFDFILPVVPVLDARNAYTHLRNILKNFPIRHDVLLKQTSLYISDMRSLQNIANEFNLFRRIVDENKNEAKIFAIIFYKNIYAQDYNLTDKNSGVLYSIVRDYRLKKLHKEYFNYLDEDKDALHAKLERLKKESASSAADVRLEIICRYISKPLWPILNFAHDQYGGRQGTDSYQPVQLYESEDCFLKFFGSDYSVYIGYHNQNYGNYHYYRAEADNVIDEYNERAKLVSTDRIKEYKRTAVELNEVKEKIRIRNSITIADLITMIGEEKFKVIAQDYIEKCKDPDILDEKQLETVRTGFRRGGFEALYYLLTNGYIMQDYMMFRSIFHEGTISVNDNDYIKAVGRFTGCKEVNDSFSLDDEKDVLSELIEQNYIYREGAIHHQLVTYMMNKQNTVNERHLSGMISKIFEKNSDEVISIFDILDSKFTQQESFKSFIVVSMEKNRYLDRMLSLIEGRESDEIQTKIIINMVAFVDINTSEDREQYRKFVEGSGYKLVSQLNSETFKPFMDNILKLGVVYDHVTLPVTLLEHNALRFVADNEMYRFDKANFRTVVAGLIEDDKVTCESVDAHPLSLVADYKLSNVKSAIEDNIDAFALEIFIGSEEKSETIVGLLQYPSLSNKVKVKILEKMQFTLPDLHLFNEAVDVGLEGVSWHDLFYQYDHVEPDWKPLLAYIYEECNISVLSDYINKNATELSNQHVDLVDGDKYDLLYMKVICNDDISDNAYASILTSIIINEKWWDERLSFSNFHRIVVNNKVCLNHESFNKVIGLFDVLTDDSECRTFLCWFIQYKNEFLSNTDFYLRADHDAVLLEDLLSEICSSSDFSVKEKAELLLKYNTTYSDSFLDSLKLSSDVIKMMVKLSPSDSLKISLIIRLLMYKDIGRADIADMVSELDETEYRKLFSQQTATLTLSNNKEAESFMLALQESELIVEWSSRQDGKYSVICRKKSRQETGNS
ncbi:TPA: DNA-binding protein [Serratia marcescens]|uniref:YobI family P-loop NTPase n=1 Tax=Serratia nevei TaxID=2703794 RepID=UPI00254C8913|nr:DNA-binding protein [Serratia nevei]MEC5552237.1 DNA-binding protein [Serratia nevei]MEC5629965.1 DNA-binding protein [Serratia nevei]MEC6071380.1 DNA-binding protein [Serratia nevei]